MRRACAKCAEDEHEHERDRRKVIRRAQASFGHDFAQVPVHARAGTGGRLLDYLELSSARAEPLAPGLRASFERSAGRSLHDVRVVADSASAGAAAELGARAFTVGSTIWFGRGEYRPDDAGGQRLIAHEVAHTMQQQHAGRSLQRELVVGGASDPEEQQADRTADALLRGDPAALTTMMMSAARGARSNVLRRTCSASDGRDEHERVVTCADGAWRVTHRRETGPAQGPQPETRGSAQLRWNDTDLWVDFTVCHGGTNIIITPRMRDIPDAAVQALSNAVVGSALGRGVQLRPGLTLQLVQSQSFSITVEGGAAFDAESGNMTGLSGTLTVRIERLPRISIGVTHTPSRTPGVPDDTFVTVDIPLPGEPRERIPRVDCTSVPPAQARDVFECRPITPARPGRMRTPRLLRSPTTRIWALFDYASDTILGWRFEGDSSEYAPGDPQIRERVMELVLGEGFSPSSVVGYTSPEGDRNRPNARPGQFPGNVPLSQQRAQRAHDVFFNELCFGCPSFERRTIVPLGLDELYSPPDVRGREVRGAPLARAAIADFLALDPLRPADPDAFRRQSFDTQREQTYRLLRRAEIRLERSEVLLAADPGEPARPERAGTAQPCPPEVERTARDAFFPPFMRGIPGARG